MKNDEIVQEVNEWKSDKRKWVDVIGGRHEGTWIHGDWICEMC